MNSLLASFENIEDPPIDRTKNTYAQFMASLFDKPEGEIIALDGKTLRRSFDKASGQKPLHILNAWAVKAGLTLAQLPIDCTQMK